MPDKQVRKYIIVPNESVVVMPKDAEILTVSVKRNRSRIRLHALVDPGNPPEKRAFVSVVSGQPIDKENLRFISTIYFNELVIHYFEDLNKTAQLNET